MPATDACAVAVVVADRATRIDLSIISSSDAILAQHSFKAQVPLSPAELAQRIAAMLQTIAMIHPSLQPGVLVCSLDAICADAATVLEYGPLAAWRSIDVAQLIQAATGLPATLATHTESALAMALTAVPVPERGAVLYIDISRAITAALSIDGRIVHRPYLGDIGHVPVRSDGIKCQCGGYGHLVTVASAQSIVREMIGRMVEYPETTQKVLDATGGAESMTVLQIWQLSCEGDPIASQIIEESIAALASVLTTCILMFDPQHIIIGGTMAACSDEWLAALRKTIVALLPPKRATSIADRMRLIPHDFQNIRQGTGILAKHSAEVLWIVS